MKSHRSRGETPKLPGFGVMDFKESWVGKEVIRFLRFRHYRRDEMAEMSRSSWVWAKVVWDFSRSSMMPLLDILIWLGPQWGSYNSANGETWPAVKK